VSRPELTPRQREAGDFIASYFEAWGFAPSFREIGQAMDIKSTNGVSDHLSALVKKGYIKRKPGCPRAMRLVDWPGAS